MQNFISSRLFILVKQECINFQIMKINGSEKYNVLKKIFGKES